jgi:two-component system sensor histidine kinase/response regulator
VVTSPSAARRLTPSTAPATRGVLEAILETSDDAILSLDTSSRITSWNRPAERLFGHSAEEILGRLCTELFAPHLRDDVQAAVDTVMAGDPVSHLETEVQRGDGMLVPISLSLCPVFDGGQEPVASVLIGRDITEQRLAQASLAEIEARVRDSEALANVGSWLWDLRTGTVQWSDEFHHIHGLEPLDFDGTWDAHLGTIHAEDRDAVRKGMEESVGSGRSFDHEYRIIRPVGDERIVHVRAQPMIGSDGAVVGLRGIGQDVTDRR